MSQEAYDAVVLLGEKGGWGNLVAKPAGKKVKKETVEEEDSVNSVEGQKNSKAKSASKRKSEDVKVEKKDTEHDPEVRRSKRNKA